VPDLTKLFDELTRLETELWNSVDARLRAEHGLALSRLQPMRVIDSKPRCRVHDIAAELSITTGGTSKLVDAIEAAGHCHRRPNPDDRRSSIVELTPAGQRLLEQATNTFEDELERRVGSVLPRHSIVQLTDALTRLRAGEQSGRASLAA
jgi:DNA-binding MarR family transcriptional regulator